MENKVEKWLKKRSQDISNEWKEITDDEMAICESPIEKLFLMEWKYQKEAQPYSEYYYLIPQYKIGDYRVDFLVYYHHFSKLIKKNEYPEDNKGKSLIVELDSYFWHGTSSEQFTKEKERERELQKEGWNIMRFSGREIYRDVERCVEEVFEYFSKIEREMPEEYR